ncbi:hypothetical protein [Parerythrobacter lacustris]|uniref:SMP-30/Gluconolactonase/LRE-like region domain-containing protein n=1 Tax=Parerythrobacter lacustris TaxID=2969984 RepID=A0ABT1XPX4_9SPHN|nr:hypothetical protein [Parerythrobacter lacustris]MCR2833720.1 hypothetical protein [Parerythrobacter lacustris]
MRFRVAIAILALGIATPVPAQDLPAWRSVDAATGQIDDLTGLERLASDFPDSTSVRRRLLNAQLEAGDAEGALASLAWLRVRGHVFSAGAQTQIPDLVGAEHAEAARGLLIQYPMVIAASEVVATVPAEAGLVESVVSPLPGEVFVVTSITEHAVYLHAPDGQWRRGDIAGASDLSGIVADEARNIAWIASGNLDESSDSEARFSGLFMKAPDPDATIGVAAPEGVTLSDLALGPDGTVYASDPLGGGVYRVRPESELLDVLVAPGILRSPQGLAVTADGARLYVSDYRYGLAVVDLASGAVARLASDVPAALDGIDGLWRYDGELIAVQNGTSPLRISAFALSPDGARIVGHRALEQTHPDWTEPLGGSIADGALYYIGNGQWDKFEAGKPVEGKPVVATQIRRLKL